MKTRAFIFARTGSKGLAGKNKRLLCGIPLFMHSVIIARLSGFDSVTVSTDDADILAYCYANEVDTIKRPASLCTDEAPEWLSWQHALRETGHTDVFVSLPPTCPLRDVEDVRKAISALNTHAHADGAVTVTPAQHNPYFTACVNDRSGFIRPALGHRPPHRRQEAPTVYNVCGVAYAIRPAFIMRSTGLWDGQIVPVAVPPARAIDIDTSFDLHLASLLMKDKDFSGVSSLANS